MLIGGQFELPILSAQATAGTELLVCESADDTCNRPDAPFDTIWTFDGTQGRISVPADQAGTRLLIEKLDSSSIIIRRSEEAGTAPGRTAVYHGTVNGGRFTGVVEWSWPNRPEQAAHGVFAARFRNQNSTTGATSAVVDSKPIPGPGRAGALPAELLICENSGPCNAAWILNGTTGTGTWYSRNPVRATLNLVRSEPDYIMIRRTDLTGGGSATYTGTFRQGHYTGTIVWNRRDGGEPATGTWTGSLPQTSCAGRPDLDPADAMKTGQEALMFKREADSLGCYLVAAKNGDATAQAAVGLLYYQGRPSVPQSYEEAFFWLHKAADQGVYPAQRTIAEMYTAGQGTKRDATLAGIYAARADEQKHDMERRQDMAERADARREEQAERAADRANRLLSGFVLGASFGLLF